MRIAISGAGGMIGRSLADRLRSLHHTVLRLVRHPPRREDEAQWSQADGLIDPTSLKGIDALVHLAGEPIAGGRWTRTRMQRIRDSRVHGTAKLIDSLAAVSPPPKTIVGASAVGFYGNRDAEELNEESAVGEGFLAEVAQAWEAAYHRAEDLGARVATARFGVVLSPTGGALAKMLPVFRAGAGGTIGDGRQFMSWISLDDAVAALIHILDTESIRGPVNLVSPQPVTNRRFTKTLARVLKRPVIAPLPAFVARLLFGRMADEALLASVRALPTRLDAAGFGFRDLELEPTLRRLLS